MNELEKYISSNLDAFDSEPVPSGDKVRFMGRIDAERRKRRIRVIGMAFAGIAAACSALLFFLSEPDISRELYRHHTRLAEKEMEIMVLAEMNYPSEAEMIMNTVHSITAEAIPLEEQLPDGMNPREKSRILNDYYNRKYYALEKVMEQYKNHYNTN